ncbi:unnamed protein product [Thlaspi arvense]|uniref:Gnk2-homologous domain-containing protein n=1 Tax=Thlaspi arvense TaxID=13288 RepID=A0AAU9RSP8_THLAR|nr:unnamed protein product [Thlaspi arvense]
MHTLCNNESNSFTRHSSYYSNRSSALASLRTRSSVRPPIYLSVTKGLVPDTVFAMYLCRGDISKTNCSICVRTATSEIRESCTYQKEALIFYEECMVRYSDNSFFGLLDGPKSNAILYSPDNFSATSRFQQTISGKMDQLIPRAASTTSLPKPYFVQDKQRLTESGSSYTLDSVVQCRPDLDPSNCTICLRLAFQRILDCCSRSRSVHNFRPECLIKYHIKPSPLNVPSHGVIKVNVRLLHELGDYHTDSKDERPHRYFDGTVLSFIDGDTIDGRHD